MHRWLVVLATVVAATIVAAPRTSAGDAPIGRLGDTLRVDTGKIIADVTVSSVQPVEPPPASGYKRSGVPLKAYPNTAVARADVTIHTIEAPNPFQMATDFTFDGVTPFAEAYTSWPSDAPDQLYNALTHAPPGSTVQSVCIGTPTAIPSPTSCCSTARPGTTSHSGTFDVSRHWLP